MAYPVRVAAARLARAEKQRQHAPSPAADAEALDARRSYATERLAERIREVVDSAPPLTDEQRTRLAGLLAPYAGGDAA